MKTKIYSFKRLMSSFGYAIQGLKTVVFEEVNFQLHLVFTGLAIFMAWLLGLEAIEWMILMLVIGFVLSLEIINTAIERLADFVSPQLHPQIKDIKDLSAAAVLVFAAIALLIAIILFVPKLWLVVTL